MSSTVDTRRSIKRPFAVLSVGALLGLLSWLCGVDARPDLALHARLESVEGAKVVRAAASGVYVMRAPVTDSSQARAPRPAEARPPHAPPLPFSFLGKITDGVQTQILLYAAGRTFRVSGQGPLDDRYQVDEVHDDRLVIRYLALGTQQVLPLIAQQVRVPGSLGGEYPQD